MKDRMTVTSVWVRGDFAGGRMCSVPWEAAGPTLCGRAEQTERRVQERPVRSALSKGGFPYAQF